MTGLSPESCAAIRAYGELCVEAGMLGIPLDDQMTPRTFEGMAMTVTLVRKGYPVGRALKVGRTVDKAMYREGDRNE